MSRRTTAIAAALSVLAIGSPLMNGCGAKSIVTGEVPNAAADLNSEDILSLNDEIADFNQVIEINPKDALAYLNRGVAKFNLKDYQGSIADFNQAIEINPQFAGAFINRGVSKGNLKDYQGAIGDFNKAIQINPQDTLPYT